MYLRILKILPFFPFFALLILVECSSQQHAGSYNFIIVGAGTAGSVLAGRLCVSLPRANILLIEQGHSRSDTEELLVRAPRYAMENWRPSSLVDTVETEPNKGLDGRSVTYVVGRTLGGSSAINGVQWTVPPLSTVTTWGIQGLGTVANIRRLYLKAYDRIDVKKPRMELRHSYTTNLTRSARSVGFNIKWGLNSLFSFQGKDDAFWVNDMTATWSGRRTDAYTAYVERAMKKEGCSSNLHVVQDATVSTLLFDGSDKESIKVIGVRYQHGKTGDVKDVYASEEVILSAGALGTPKILQLSGIGPKDVLSRAGVKLLQDLPVGKRIQTHPVTLVQSLYDSSSIQIPLEKSNNASLYKSPNELEKWRTGMPAVPGVGIACCNGRVGLTSYFASSFNGALDEKVLDSFCFTNPRSFGTSFIVSANVSAKLHVDLNLFGHPDDKQNMLACVKRIRAAHEQMQLDGFPIRDRNPNLFEGDDETVIRNLIAASGTSYHLVGACAVGSVTTNDLRVKDVIGLRVVDSTVINQIPISAGSFASTYMIAELAAEKISDIYRNRYSGTCVADGEQQNDH